MATRHIRRPLLAILLAGLLPLVAQAASAQDGGVQQELTRELAEARREVRAELATARAELDTGNLELGHGMHFGKSAGRKQDPDLPKAEITPDGDFLVDGQAVAIDANQRRQLLAYRGEVIGIARAGIDIGERSAEVALEMVDRGLFRLVLSAMTGSLERQLEKTLKETIGPGVRQICDRLPSLLDSQQHLSASLPQFRPYPTLQAEDVENCHDEIRHQFART